MSINTFRIVSEHMSLGAMPFTGQTLEPAVLEVCGGVWTVTETHDGIYAHVAAARPCGVLEYEGLVQPRDTLAFGDMGWFDSLAIHAAIDPQFDSYRKVIEDRYLYASAFGGLVNTKGLVHGLYTQSVNDRVVGVFLCKVEVG